MDKSDQAKNQLRKDQPKGRGREVLGAVMAVTVALGVYALVSSNFCQDLIRAWQYDESSEISALRADLDLTNDGKRVFLASLPALELADDFNEHCNSHRQDVSMLGCYTGGRMYIYDIKSEQLADANKVTAAHELLHAAWARMNRGEREQVTNLLAEVKTAHPDWVTEELALYQEAERTEELYTRVGTKMRELPEALEEHYKKYFNNRLQIVEFYENYQAPFNRLKQANADLKAQLDALSVEIETARQTYEARLAALETRIDEFNQCAETVGCFTSQSQFMTERNLLEQERQAVAAERNRLNERIDYNNALVAKYQENQLELGDLSNAMNSNVERIEAKDI